MLAFYEFYSAGRSDLQLLSGDAFSVYGSFSQLAKHVSKRQVQKLLFLCKNKVGSAEFPNSAASLNGSL